MSYGGEEQEFSQGLVRMWLNGQTWKKYQRHGEVRDAGIAVQRKALPGTQKSDSSSSLKGLVFTKFPSRKTDESVKIPQKVF